MDAMAKNVMRACNNYFAALYERVKASRIDAKTLEGAFEGEYTQGMLLRVHGSFTGSWGDMGEGELYEVVDFDGERLTLDHKLHTAAPWLLIVYCEPPSEFMELCERVASWEEKNGESRGLASETIDGYSYSRATAPNGKSGWEGAFADELQRYRNPKPTQLYYARGARSWEVLDLWR